MGFEEEKRQEIGVFFSAMTRSEVFEAGAEAGNRVSFPPDSASVLFTRAVEVVGASWKKDRVREARQGGLASAFSYSASSVARS